MNFNVHQDPLIVPQYNITCIQICMIAFYNHRATKELPPDLSLVIGVCKTRSAPGAYTNVAQHSANKSSAHIAADEVGAGEVGCSIGRRADIWKRMLTGHSQSSCS